MWSKELRRPGENGGIRVTSPRLSAGSTLYGPRDCLCSFFPHLPAVNFPCSPLSGSGELAVRASQGLWKDTSRISCVCSGSVSGDILICAQVCSLEWHWLPLVWCWWNRAEGLCLKCAWNFSKGKSGSRAGDHSVMLYCLYGSFPEVLKKRLVYWLFEKVILDHRLPATLQ